MLLEFVIRTKGYSEASSLISLITSELTCTCPEITGIRPSCDPRCKHPEYYSFNYAVVGTLFQSIIFVIGVLGNVLVCTVVYREGEEKKGPTGL